MDDDDGAPVENMLSREIIRKLRLVRGEERGGEAGGGAISPPAAAPAKRDNNQQTTPNHK